MTPARGPQTQVFCQLLLLIIIVTIVVVVIVIVIVIAIALEHHLVTHSGFFLILTVLVIVIVRFFRGDGEPTWARHRGVVCCESGRKRGWSRGVKSPVLGTGSPPVVRQSIVVFFG